MVWINQWATLSGFGTFIVIDKKVRVAGVAWRGTRCCERSRETLQSAVSDRAWPVPGRSNRAKRATFGRSWSTARTGC